MLTSWSCHGAASGFLVPDQPATRRGSDFPGECAAGTPAPWRCWVTARDPPRSEAASRPQNSRSPSHPRANSRRGTPITAGACSLPGPGTASYGGGHVRPARSALSLWTHLSSHGRLPVQTRPRLGPPFHLDSVSSCECVHDRPDLVSVHGNSQRTIVVSSQGHRAGCRQGEASLRPQVSELLP